MSNPKRPIDGPFWRYYGGKWRAATLYPGPRHKLIVEPFAGAAGYALRHAHHEVLLIDASEKICAVWDYLIRATSAEIRALPDPVRGVSVDEFDVPQEARWLMGLWYGGGAESPRQRPSPWSIRDMASTRERAARQVDSIRHWRIVHGTYRDAPDVEATWYVDPPYQGRAGRKYPCGSDAIDYADLGAWCRSRIGQVMVCEGPDADWLPFSPLATIRGANGTHRSGTSEEVIWCNDGWRPPVQGALL